MKVTPIIFNAEMVRALLDGRKTQTRRVITPRQFKPSKGSTFSDLEDVGFWRSDARCAWLAVLKKFPGVVVGKAICPYGQPGDLLWVREDWKTGNKLDKFNATQIKNLANGAGYDDSEPHGPLLFLANDAFTVWGDNDKHDFGEWGRRRASRFMPRWASRLTLRLTDVRVERVQDISGRDARSEGARFLTCFGPDCPPFCNERGCFGAYEWFQLLWNKINAKRGWDTNPWVWALTFEVIKSNVDEVLKND